MTWMDDPLDISLSYGDDSLPLMARVEEPPPSHWGKVTSQDRMQSQAYLKFLGKGDDDVVAVPPPPPAR